MDSTSQQPQKSKKDDEKMNFIKIRHQHKQQICIKSYYNLRKSFFHNLNDNEPEAPKQVSKLATPKPILIETPEKSNNIFDIDKNNKTLHKPRYSGTFMMKTVEKELGTIDLSKYIQELQTKDVNEVEELPPDPKDKKEAAGKKKEDASKKKKGPVKTPAKKGEKKAEIIISEPSEKSLPGKKAPVAASPEKFNRPKIMFFGDP